MKNLVILAVLAIIFVSCEKEEIVAPQHYPIPNNKFIHYPVDSLNHQKVKMEWVDQYGNHGVFNSVITGIIYGDHGPMRTIVMNGLIFSCGTAQPGYQAGGPLALLEMNGQSLFTIKAMPVGAKGFWNAYTSYQKSGIEENDSTIVASCNGMESPDEPTTKFMSMRITIYLK